MIIHQLQQVTTFLEKSMKEEMIHPCMGSNKLKNMIQIKCSRDREMVEPRRHQLMRILVKAMHKIILKE
jgi:hypothetical protein